MNIALRLKLLRWAKALTLRTFVLMIVALAASIGFALIARALRHPAFDRVDAEIELFVHHHLDSSLGDAWAMTSSFIGSGAVLVPVVIGVAALAVVRHHRVAAVVLAIDAIVATAGDALLKVMLQRPRPQLFDKIALPHDYSFPSGHSMSAVGVWGVIAAVLCAIFPSARTPIVVCSIVLVLSIGLSRIYLGVHWPFDVVGGFLAGVPLLVASVHLIGRRGRHDANVADLVERLESP
jgi:undecaprenyl-diphosphatase